MTDNPSFRMTLEYNGKRHAIELGFPILPAELLDTMKQCTLLFDDWYQSLLKDENG